MSNTVSSDPKVIEVNVNHLGMLRTLEELRGSTRSATVLTALEVANVLTDVKVDDGRLVLRNEKANQQKEIFLDCRVSGKKPASDTRAPARKITVLLPNEAKTLCSNLVSKKFGDSDLFVANRAISLMWELLFDRDSDWCIGIVSKEGEFKKSVEQVLADFATMLAGPNLTDHRLEVLDITHLVGEQDFDEKSFDKVRALLKRVLGSARVPANEKRSLCLHNAVLSSPNSSHFDGGLFAFFQYYFKYLDHDGYETEMDFPNSKERTHAAGKGMGAGTETVRETAS